MSSRSFSLARTPMTVHSNSDGRDHPPAAPIPSLDDDDGVEDSFEFFSLRRSPRAMCAADDVFLAGKILPFGAPPPSRSTEAHSHQPPRENAAEVIDAARPSRRFWAGRGGAAKAKANYRRLKSASDADVTTKSFPPPPHAGTDAAAAAATKQRPRWYLYVLGSMRVPATMDLSDIRSRQQRRRCPPAEATEASVDANRGTWKLLRSLSCKGLESAGVSVTFVRDLQGV